jgi:hypothetical protein
MNVAAGPELAAAVTNAGQYQSFVITPPYAFKLGGLGVIGGVGYTPKVLRQQVRVQALGHPIVTYVSNRFKLSRRISRTRTPRSVSTC